MTELRDYSAIQVLYVGRAECEWTKKALTFLTSMGIQPTVVLSRNRGEKFPTLVENDWNGDLVISYRTHFIIPEKILQRSTHGGLNVHAGSPSFPGSGAVNWALYEEMSSFGITVHQITSKVDAGEVAKVYPFEVYTFDNFDTLSDRTDSQSFLAFCDFFSNYFNSSDLGEIPRIESSWTRNARTIKELDKLEMIQPSLSKVELEKIIRATVSKSRAPYIDLYGYIFKLIN